MIEQPNLMPFLLPGGALNMFRTPDCWERRAHIERYQFACEVTPGMRVLDFGCGCGYGSAMLAKDCASVMAVDTDETALRIARMNYEASNLVFTEPHWDFDPFDACVALEVLEHMQDPEAFIDTVKARHLIASVPVIPTVHFNPHHKRDFTIASARALIERRFDIRWWWLQVPPFHHEAAVAVFHGEARA